MSLRHALATVVLAPLLLLQGRQVRRNVPVLPELRKLGATRLVCFYGADEKDTLCPDLTPPAIVVKMSGGHHLDGAYEAIGRKILTTVDSR